MPNPNHDEKGRFAAGSSEAAATGDHAKVSPDAARRNLPGHGNLPRSKVVGRHAGRNSVGTSSGGGGGGQGGGGHMSAKEERIKMRQQVDQRHMPNRTDAEVASMTALGQPLGTRTAPGKLDPRQSSFVSAHGGTGGKPRVRVRAR